MLVWRENARLHFSLTQKKQRKSRGKIFLGTNFVSQRLHFKHFQRFEAEPWTRFSSARQTISPDNMIHARSNYTDDSWTAFRFIIKSHFQTRLDPVAKRQRPLWHLNAKERGRGRAPPPHERCRSSQWKAHCVLGKTGWSTRPLDQLSSVNG